METMATSLSILLWLAAIPAFADDEDTEGTEDDDLAQWEIDWGVVDYLWVLYIMGALVVAAMFVLPCGKWNMWCQEATFDALSKECYVDIINARDYDADNKVVGDDRPLALLVMRRDLKEKRVWHDDWKKDFLVFLRNEHSLFSTCYSHPDHPFSRRDRRCILLSVILMNFGIAMGTTYFFATAQLGEWSEYVVDKLLSYIFGFQMSILESALVFFAVCGGAEKCPNCIRSMTRCCSSMVIAQTLCWAVIGFGGAMAFMGLVSFSDGTEVFWAVFFINYVLGLMQAWFLVDLVSMAMQFRTEWKAAHPTPPDDPENGEDKKCENSTAFKLAKYWSFLVCCPLWTCWCVLCRKKARKDPYDDGQDDFGVNYKEYVAWRTGGDIGDRKLPTSYQNLSLHNTARAAKKAKEQAIHKVDGAKTAVNAKTAKWKEKAVGIRNKVKGQKGDDADAETEDKELIVGGGKKRDTLDELVLAVEQDPPQQLEAGADGTVMVNNYSSTKM